MFLSEFDEEKFVEQTRQEERWIISREIATNLLQEGGMSASFIARMCKISEDTVRQLAKDKGIAIL